jgi:hypothetical protein
VLGLSLADVQAVLIDQAAAVLTCAAVLALVGGLESALNLLALDQQLDRRATTRATSCWRWACATWSAGALGGPAGGGAARPCRWPSCRPGAAADRGRRSRDRWRWGCCTWLGAPLLAMLPLPVLGGIMVTVAHRPVDRWTHAS